MTSSPPQRRGIREPSLVLLALVAVTVMTLCIFAIFATDDAWIVLLTVVAIAVIAIAIVIGLWRLLGATDERPPGGD